MNTIIISRNLIKNDDLVIIPRKFYEEFLLYRLEKESEDTALNAPQKKRLQKARKNLTNKNYLTIHELKNKLGVKN